MELPDISPSELDSFGEDIKKCIENNVCTFTISRSNMKVQAYYECPDCPPGYSMCPPCRKSCHNHGSTASHHPATSHKTGPCYCDCGDNNKSCAAMPGKKKNQQPQQNQNKGGGGGHKGKNPPTAKLANEPNERAPAPIYDLHSTPAKLKTILEDLNKWSNYFNEHRNDAWNYAAELKGSDNKRWTKQQIESNLSDCEGMWNNFEQELRLLREANANHPVIAAHEEAVRNLRATFEAKKKQWLAEPNSGDRSHSSGDEQGGDEGGDENDESIIFQNAQKAFDTAMEGFDFVSGSITIDDYSGDSYVFPDNPFSPGEYRNCDMFRVCLGELKRASDRSKKGAQHHRDSIAALQAKAEKEHERLCVKWADEFAKNGDYFTAEHYVASLKQQLPHSKALPDLQARITAGKEAKLAKEKAAADAEWAAAKAAAAARPKGSSTAAPAPAKNAKPTNKEQWKQRLYGKIKIVDIFPDVKVLIVDSCPDLKVQKVDCFPDKPGKWQLVDTFPDWKVQIVDNLNCDLKIKWVDSFPGPC